MGTRYQKEGRVLTYANASGSDIDVNDTVVMTDSVGFAQVDIPDGESGEVAVEGVFEAPKAAATAWTIGALLDWDASAGAFTIGVTPASGDVEGCAYAAAAAGSADTTGLVKLANPGAGTP